MNDQAEYHKILERLEQLEKENALLKDENKKFFSAVEYSPATIVITDLNGKISYANPGFSEITGYTKGEAMGMNPRFLKSGVHPPGFYAQLWETILSGNVWRGEFYNRKKNGEFYWEQAHIGPIFNNEGEIAHFVAIKFDITRKKESEQYLKTIVSAIPESIFVMDEDGRYVDIMVSDEKSLSLIKEKYKGKLVHETIPGPLADKLNDHIAATISTQSKQVIEYEMEMPSGNVWFEGHSAPIGIKINGKKCIIIAAHDITERKKTEQKLLELNATKDKFFSIMAHDLKNPFSVILTFSKMLSESVAQNEISERLQISKHIRSSAELIFDLLENLLQWARSQTGRLEFCPQQFQLSDIINETLKIHEYQAMSKKIALSNAAPSDFLVYADMNLSKTVLRNLVSNAIKYTPADGEVKVSASDFANFVQISVSDTGIGIPANSQQKLFRIDSKYSTAGTENEKGTGLGLILCKEFVELNGGKIWVESEEGKGSNFIFTLPKPSPFYGYSQL